MTDKELHKLKKSELLEILVAMREEMDRLAEENEQLRQRINGEDEDLLGATARRVKRIYEDKFGEDEPKDEPNEPDEPDEPNENPEESSEDTGSGEA